MRTLDFCPFGLGEAGHDTRYGYVAHDDSRAVGFALSIHPYTTDTIKRLAPAIKCEGGTIRFPRMLLGSVMVSVPRLVPFRETAQGPIN